jgi:hypothetical protein
MKEKVGPQQVSIPQGPSLIRLVDSSSQADMTPRYPRSHVLSQPHGGKLPLVFSVDPNFCYDNSMCESFFATPECELIDRSRFPHPRRGTHGLLRVCPSKVSIITRSFGEFEHDGFSCEVFCEITLPRALSHPSLRVIHGDLFLTDQLDAYKNLSQEEDHVE